MSPLPDACAASPAEPLWPEGVPGAARARLQPGPELYNDGCIANVAVPTLTRVSPPAGMANGAAAIICPGGGYVRLSAEKEGLHYARWLAGLGVTGFVLKYRLAEFGHPAPLQDVLRAMRLLRSRAPNLGLDPERIGVVGSSAGGHLAASAGTLYGHPDGRTGAALDAVCARPDFMVLLYPVIAMEGPAAHAGSRRALLGDDPAPELVRRLSLATQVGAATPPAILFHTQGDAAVPADNSIAFYQALTRAGVPAELHVFERGGHGIGMAEGLGTASDWPRRAAEWLRMRGLLDKARAATAPA